MFIDLTLDSNTINKRYLIAIDNISYIEEAGEGTYIRLKTGETLSIEESIDYVKSFLNVIK